MSENKRTPGSDHVRVCVPPLQGCEQDDQAPHVPLAVPHTESVNDNSREGIRQARVLQIWTVGPTQPVVWLQQNQLETPQQRNTPDACLRAVSARSAAQRPALPRANCSHTSAKRQQTLRANTDLQCTREGHEASCIPAPHTSGLKHTQASKLTFHI